MLDRIDLIVELNRLPLTMTASGRSDLVKTLDKAAGQMLAKLSLADARQASSSVQKLIAASFDECLSMKELLAVSKAWEPKRAVPKSIAHAELASDLVALMEGERRPFEPTKLGLAQARSLGEKDRAELVLGIQRLASMSQLKAILKKWDKASPLNTGGDEKAIRAALLGMLNA